MGKYQFEDNVAVPNGRAGPKLDKFELKEMKVGQSFLIPYVKRSIRGKDKQVPEAGFNVKMANKVYAPMVFTKKRMADGVRVFRTE